MCKEAIERYEEKANAELKLWQAKMQKSHSVAGLLSKAFQKKMNGLIPDKIHQYITNAIKQMVRFVLYGSTHAAGKPMTEGSLLLREE